MNIQIAAFADEADGTLSGQIQAMKRNDIRLLEIRGVDGENIADLTEEKAKDIKKRLADEGMAVWSLGSPYGKIGIHDAFEPHLDKFKHGLDLAAILGAENIRLFSFYVCDEEKESQKDEVFRRLEHFITAAKGYDVTLCHENEKGIYGDMANRCLAIHEEFPALRAVYDPANFIQCHEEALPAYQMLKPYIKYLHIKDALEDGSVVPCGKGLGHLPEILADYNSGIITIEPHLSVFAGLSDLEAAEKSKVGSYCYPSSGAAFDAAVTAAKQYIQ